MTRKARNLLCLSLILAGLLNYLAYGISYAWLQGDAKNGYVTFEEGADGTVQAAYFVRGHFIRHGSEGKSREVTRSQWIYSYIHSISIWLTHAVVLLSMLTLAQPYIIAIMRHSPVRGSTYITVVATLIAVIFGAATVWFTLEFLSELHKI